MTLKVDSKEGFVRALFVLAEDMNRGLIVSCSTMYEVTGIGRISAVYVVGREKESALPSLPGVVVDSSEADTEPG